MKNFVTLALVGLATSSLFIGSAIVKESAIAEESTPGLTLYSTNANVALDGNWLLEWSVSGIYHRARLSMDGNFGTMIVDARMPNGNLIAAEERIILTPTENGLILRASTPTYPGSSQPVPNYNADTFRIQSVRRGRLTQILHQG